jgi:hypothetical protein
MIGKVLFLIENRHFLIRKCHFGLGRGPYVGHVSPTPTLSYSGVYHDPPQTTRRHRHHRFGRSHRLLGHDGSEERHNVPNHERVADLHEVNRPRLPVSFYAEATVALRSSEIARTTVATSSGTQAGGAFNAGEFRGTERTRSKAACALKAIW